MKKKLIVITLVAFTSVLGLYFGFTSGGQGSTNSSNSVKETEEPMQQPAPPDAYVTIDGSVRYQTIDNFGASDAWSMEPLGKHWTEQNKNRVADLLFSREKGIGLSAWRFNIGAGSTETDQTIIPDPWRQAEAFKTSEDGDYDWSKQAGQQWFLQAAKARGVDTLIAFSNSPPVWMTKNGHAQPDPDIGSTNLKDGYEDEFATYLIDVLEHFRQEGLVFQYISPINEPTWDWNKAQQEGNRYNNDDLKRVILELHQQLKESSLDAQISAPDGVEITSLLDDEYYQMFAGGGQYSSGANSLGTGKYREYIKDLLGDPNLKEAVGNKIASHSYWSDYSKPGDDRLGKLRELLDANLKKYDAEAKYWVTEYCILGDYGPGRDLGMDPALHVARTIHFDLTEANAAAWQWWTAVSKVDYKDGLIYTDYKKAGDEQNVLTSKIMWALGNYSKFIRPGAERISLAGLDENSRNGLLGSAYVHEGEQTVTAVFVNDSDEDKRIRISLNGVDKNRAIEVMQLYITSAGRDLAQGEDVPILDDHSFEAVIPAKSVVTLTGGGADGTVEANVDKESEVTTEMAGKHGNSGSDDEAVQQVKEALTVYNIDNVRGNLTLLERGDNGTSITWQSDNPSVIAASGVVTRPKHGSGNVSVTLIAAISRNDVKAEKKFKVVVMERPVKEEYAGYLFSYFTGEGTPDGEQIYFALSEGNDPLHWKELNGGKPVLSSTMGEKGVRDPFIIRSPEGDKFFMIATDLKINGDWNWDRAQREGSRSIMVWESGDLLKWSEPRMIEISPAEAGNTWAPEVFYDETTGEYIVFWASKLFADESHVGDAYQKIMYSKTRDFHVFTEAQVYMDFGYSIIDTTMISHKGKIYRFTKDERDNQPLSLYGKMVFQEVLGSVFDSGYRIIKEGVGSVKGVEGPTVFKSNTEEKWYLFVDEFGGRGYVPLETTDLDSGVWKVSPDYDLPNSPRHGTVIPITKTEYDAINAKYFLKR
ncbi:O-glycosyl hydrolase [Paenibacillus castaneae]|uniref:glycoside hydrolase n=1 Tax=Paenibacillus castaneae TaxID=474957 RepID=UPI001FBA1CE5|nr:glycoside hydrolase [Paenibacillus castaneae]NIK75091.1 O-glycosyl hydrolase [Paenibacillus castaneae]